MSDRKRLLEERKLGDVLRDTECMKRSENVRRAISHFVFQTSWRDNGKRGGAGIGSRTENNRKDQTPIARVWTWKGRTFTGKTARGVHLFQKVG